jgi:hypothetical protein
MMKKILGSFVSLMITLLPCEPAWAWGHANRWGGGTSTPTVVRRTMPEAAPPITARQPMAGTASTMGDPTARTIHRLP